MTEIAERMADRIRWSWGVAAIGLSIAVLAAIVPFVGLPGLGPLYWLGIALSLGGILGAAVFGSQSIRPRFGIGVVSGVGGVLVAAYGVENQMIVATIVGILVVVIAATVVFADTRRVA